MLKNNEILLRAPEPEDLAMFYKWENDCSLWQFGSTIAPFSQYILKEYIANAGGDFFTEKQLRLIITLKQTGQAVGSVDLFDFDPFHRRAAVGVLIDPDYQSKGYAVQALSIIKEYALGFLGINMLYAHVPVANGRSVKLFENCGYEKSGLLKSWLRNGNKYEDVLLLQIFK